MATRLSQSDFPGYAEAVARENIVRAAACLGIRERVCGIEVLPLTSRHVRWLAMFGSPFILRGITAESLCEKPNVDLDCLLFLWVISPKFKPENIRARNKFFKHIKPIMKLKINEVVKEIMGYIEEAYLDAGNPSTEEKSYYAFEISIVTTLHKQYGLPVDFWETGWLRGMFRRIIGKPSPLDVPLKIFWQFQKAERKAANPDAPLSNASCKFLADGLSRINRMNEYIRDLSKDQPQTGEPTRTDINGSEYGLN